jgi:cytochrome c2
MPRVRRLATRWGKLRLAALAAVLCLAVLLGGCDLQENADTQRGRKLFQTKCGTCHTLAEAATTSQIGPDLDAAFQAAREVGADQDTIEGVVAAQIENPRPASPDQTHIYMPKGLVEGQDLEDVTAYVGSVAGVPGIKPPVAPGGPGGQVFANNGCGSCHTLQAALSTGTTGPNLDDVIPGQSEQEVEQSIVDPSANIEAGFEDVMPKDYEQTIEPKDLQLLVRFLLDCTANPGSSKCE